MLNPNSMDGQGESLWRKFTPVP